MNCITRPFAPRKHLMSFAPRKVCVVRFIPSRSEGDNGRVREPGGCR